MGVKCNKCPDFGEWHYQHRGDCVLSPTYTRDDLVRAVLAQQWAMAVCMARGAKPKYSYAAAIVAAQIPSPSRSWPSCLEVASERHQKDQRAS